MLLCFSVNHKGGGGSSAETGLIVFVVLLVVALIGSVVAIVILVWMVREMQSERMGKGGHYIDNTRLMYIHKVHTQATVTLSFTVINITRELTLQLKG